MQGENLSERYFPQSLPQMPVATTRRRPASVGISGSGNSRNSVWRGLVITAARVVVFALMRFCIGAPSTSDKFTCLPLKGGGRTRRSRGLVGVCRYAAAPFQGATETWITSSAPFPATDLIAQSTSLKPNVCVIAFSSGKRCEESCFSASSQARYECPRALFSEAYFC